MVPLGTTSSLSPDSSMPSERGRTIVSAALVTIAEAQFYTIIVFSYLVVVFQDNRVQAKCFFHCGIKERQFVIQMIKRVVRDGYYFLP